MALIYKPEPTEELWLRKAEEFLSRTHFPNCIGALDGKHIRMVKPVAGGSLYYNYKLYQSINLLALAYANYSFIGIDVGGYGRSSDANLFKSSIVGKRLASGNLKIPDARLLPNQEGGAPMPFVIVVDEGFGLGDHVLRPYSSQHLTPKTRIFNYRLTIARRFVECTFGNFANKWRVFHTAIELDADFVEIQVKATTVLPNFVRLRDGFTCEDTLQDPMEITPSAGTGGDNVKHVRDTFADYFVSPAGSVPWQYKVL